MTAGGDRRSAPRLLPEHTPYSPPAVLRPGRDVTIVNISSNGALVRSASRISPGADAELQLTGRSRFIVCGRILRAVVISIDPLSYEAAIVFDAPLVDVGSGSE